MKSDKKKEKKDESTIISTDGAQTLDIGKKNTRDWAIIIYQLIASLFYCACEFSMIPESRLSFLEQDGAIDYFPNRFGFLFNALITLIWSAMWFTYGLMNKQRHGGDDGMIFEYPKVRQAFVLPSCMILYGIASLFFPYVQTVSPFPPFVISLLSSVGMAYACFRSSPEDLNKMDMSFAKKFMVQSLPVWVLLWEVSLLLFWVVEITNIYAPIDYSTKLNIESPSPSPTDYHQKTMTQNVGCGMAVLNAIIGIIVESNIRTYTGAFASMVFLVAVAVDGNQTYWFAVGGIIALGVCEIIVIFVDLFKCRHIITDHDFETIRDHTIWKKFAITEKKK